MNPSFAEGLCQARITSQQRRRRGTSPSVAASKTSSSPTAERSSVDDLVAAFVACLHQSGDAASLRARASLRVPGDQTEPTSSLSFVVNGIEQFL